MNAREWHWARLKKDVCIDDSALLLWIKSDLFTVPEGSLVFAYFYTNFYGETVLRITISGTVLEKNKAAYQAIYNVNYSDLLEPLE